MLNSRYWPQKAACSLIHLIYGHLKERRTRVTGIQTEPEYSRILNKWNSCSINLKHCRGLKETRVYALSQQRKFSRRNFILYGSHKVEAPKTRPATDKEVAAVNDLISRWRATGGFIIFAVVYVLCMFKFDYGVVFIVLWSIVTTKAWLSTKLFASFQQDSVWGPKQLCFQGT